MNLRKSQKRKKKTLSMCDSVTYPHLGVKGFTHFLSVDIMLFIPSWMP